MEVQLRSIIGIFVIKNNDLNLLMYNNNLIDFEINDEIEISNKNYIKKYFDIEIIKLKQCYTFVEKVKEKLVVNVLFYTIINYEDIKDNNNLKFTLVQEIENKYISKLLEHLKNDLLYFNNIKKVYMKEFKLPDLQKFYESLLNIKLDRRNFRKKLINSNLIEPLYKNQNNASGGRPARLYKFKNIDENIIIL